MYMFIQGDNNIAGTQQIDRFSCAPSPISLSCCLQLTSKSTPSKWNVACAARGMIRNSGNRRFARNAGTPSARRALPDLALEAGALCAASLPSSSPTEASLMCWRLNLRKLSLLQSPLRLSVLHAVLSRILYEMAMPPTLRIHQLPHVKQRKWNRRSGMTSSTLVALLYPAPTTMVHFGPHRRTRR